MDLLIGIDLGTTKSTAIAVDALSGAVLAKSFVETEGRNPNPDVAGRSEWNASKVLDCGLQCLKQLTRSLGNDASSVIAIGVTGQQHGTVIVDASKKSQLRPLTPFVNWQDQRGNEATSAESKRTWIELARERLGKDSIRSTGCRLNTGFLATTLFWLSENDLLPPQGVAAFISDVFVAQLTETFPVCEPTHAGGSGVFDVASRQWASDLIKELGLNENMFPSIVEADVEVGRLSKSIATGCGLAAGIPVYPSIGDHQASFLGSVAKRHASLLINVGTGAQVAAFTDGLAFEPPIELRPFPLRGNLLSNVGLAGGWSYQVVETFIRQIGEQLFESDSSQRLFSEMTELAGQASSGAEGIEFTPTFSGTRTNPFQRGSITGLSPENFTPRNLIRATIEGMAQGYKLAYEQILAVTNQPRTTLIGAGNGLRENAVLANCVASKFNLPPLVTEHREEAAFGAALISGIGCKFFSSLDDAGKLIRHHPARLGSS